VQGSRGAIEGSRFNDFAAETRAAWAAGDLPPL
jgi:queuine tRNA-ribosyltransferase